MGASLFGAPLYTLSCSPAVTASRSAWRACSSCWVADADQGVRFSAAATLGWIGDARAVKPLIQLLSDTAEAMWEEHVCDAAAKALKQIGTDEALTAVEAWREEQGRS